MGSSNESEKEGEANIYLITNYENNEVTILIL